MDVLRDDGKTIVWHFRYFNASGVSGPTEPIGPVFLPFTIDEPLVITKVMGFAKIRKTGPPQNYLACSIMCQLNAVGFVVDLFDQINQVNTSALQPGWATSPAAFSFQFTPDMVSLDNLKVKMPVTPTAYLQGYTLAVFLYDQGGYQFINTDQVECDLYLTLERQNS